MKRLFVCCLLIISIHSHSQKTESPYLQVLTPEAIIPLKDTSADVQISGSIAHVHISQTYHNTGSTPIEAKYVFPLSLKAAVHKMQFTIGDRTISAKIFEKQKAQQVYDKALKEGRRAAKLDQHRPNVFEMNVGNIMLNDIVVIDIYYTEMLVPTSGHYEFVFPALVGPRFTGESNGSTSVFNQPYNTKGTSDTFTFNLSAQINAGMAIADVSSKSHQINVHYPNSQIAEVSLAADNVNPSNRDFILNYNMQGNAIQTGMLLFEGSDEKFFAYMMEPPKAQAQTTSTSKEYLFVVDVSGSMDGYPLEVSKKLMRNLLVNLPETDHFNILLFASSSEVLSPSPLVCSNENIERGLRFLSSARGGGGTQLLNALKTAYQLPRMDYKSARSMVVITDGYISVEREAFELIEKNLGQANVFTFGIGSSVNRHLIEGMAKVSSSESFIVTDMSEANDIADRFRNYISRPLLTQIGIKAEGFEVYDVSPGSIPDVFASRPIMIFGKYRGDAKGKLTISGRSGNGKFETIYNISDATLSRSNEALKYLWARKRIERLDDYKNLFGDETKKQVIELGLKYNLITRYTSFVAVDHEVVNKNGKRKSVKQPLPLPMNVNNSAVGAEASVTGRTVITGKVLDQSKAKTWLRTNYKSILDELLKKYDGIEIHLKSDGTILEIKTLKHGQWRLNVELIKLFVDHSIASGLNLSEKVAVTFR
ncbi:MAG: VWA domain-containing protein [Psychroserpens sp.]|nr:VWA domain-containing protein [Psychroserpens sp.]